MKYYLERQEGQNELVLLYNFGGGTRIELSEDWAYIMEQAMIRAGAQAVERGNLKEYRL